MKRLRAIGGREYPKFYRTDKDQVDLREILSQLPPIYLASSKRLRCDKPIASIEVIANTQYYEEGDWWALTLLSIGHTDDTCTLAFFPIMQKKISGAERKYWTNVDRLLADSPGLIAYGIGTKFEFRCGTYWIAYDAFFNESFAKVLLRMFWPSRAFYSLEAIATDGEEAITFRSSKDMSDYVMSRKASTEVQRTGDVRICCGELKLMIPRVCGNAPLFEDGIIEEIGRIECRTQEDVITIGVLAR